MLQQNKRLPVVLAILCLALVYVLAPDPGMASVSAHPHLPISRFECRHLGGKPVEVLLFAAACQSGENMIHAEEQPPFG